jgi:hypothetical protein
MGARSLQYANKAPAYADPIPGQDQHHEHQKWTGWIPDI